MHTFRKSFGWSVALLLITAWTASTAWADQDSFSSLAFRPAPGRGPYLYLSDTYVKDTFDFNVGMVLDYARTPFKTAVAGTTQTINKRMLTDHLLFDINATPYLQFGFDVPFVLFNQFYNPATAFSRENQFDLGDPLVMIKGEILDPITKPIGLAIIPYATVPLGNGRTFTGTNEVSPGVKMAVEKKWDKASVNLNMGYLFQNNITRVGVNIDDMITYGLGTAIQLPWKLTLVGEIDGRTVAKNAFGGKIQSPAQVTAALRKTFDTGLAIEAGGGVGIARGVGAPVARGFIGISCNKNCFHGKPKPDRDGDGVPDDVDQCPDTAGIRSNKGCPESDIKVMNDHIETPTIYFEFGKAILKADGMLVLNRLVEAVKARPKLKGLRIEGHTDNVGSRPANLRLSKNRARTVRTYLESKGIGIYLESEGYGYDRPIADNKTDEGRGKNRRVDFLILDK